MTRVWVFALCAVLLAPVSGLTQMWPGSSLCGDPNASVAVAGRIGWVEHDRGLSFAIDEYQYQGLSYELRQQAPLRGPWFEMAISACLSERLAVRVAGGALVPTETEGIDSVSGPAGALGYGLRSTDSAWRFVEAAGGYRVFGPVEVVGGFRWDFFTGKFTFEPETLGWEYDITINGYIPFLGVQSVDRFFGGDLTVRLVGAPWVPGDMELVYTAPGVHEAGDQSFQEGRFIEFFAEYRRSLAGYGRMGAFLRWTGVEGRAGSGEYTGVGAIGSYSGPARLAFGKRSLTLGGSVSLDFDLF
jgi:hypothetical protein